MYPSSPKISFITATYCASQFLQQALISLLRQSNPNWEMLISPDDGMCYEYATAIDARIRHVRTQTVKTGPGPARNRALALASGDYIAVLDDDDRLAPNFVAIVLEALKNVDMVSVPTAYFSVDGKLIREVGHHLESMSINDFSRQLGSMHVISKRVHYPKWQNCFAQDVLHTCQMIDQAGGRIQVARTTRYLNTVRNDSVCTRKRDIDFEYRCLIADSKIHISSDGIAKTRELFAYRRQINADFEQRVDKRIGFHEFLSTN